MSEIINMGEKLSREAAKSKIAAEKVLTLHKLYKLPISSFVETGMDGMSNGRGGYTR